MPRGIGPFVVGGTLHFVFRMQSTPQIFRWCKPIAWRLSLLVPIFISRWPSRWGKPRTLAAERQIALPPSEKGDPCSPHGNTAPRRTNTAYCWRRRTLLLNTPNIGLMRSRPRSIAPTGPSCLRMKLRDDNAPRAVCSWLHSLMHGCIRAADWREEGIDAWHRMRWTRQPHGAEAQHLRSCGHQNAHLVPERRHFRPG